MKAVSLKSCAAASALALALLSSAAQADDFKRITTEDDFRSMVVGKKLYHNENYLTAKKNGQVVGNFGGKALKGAWAWRDGYFCRTLTTHSKDTDCQLWTVSGKQHKVTRQRGEGVDFTYVEK